MFPGTRSDIGIPSLLKPIFLLHLDSLRFGLYDDEVSASLAEYASGNFPYGLAVDLGRLIRGRDSWGTSGVRPAIGANKITFELGKRVMKNSNTFFRIGLRYSCNYGPFTYCCNTWGNPELTQVRKNKDGGQNNIRYVSAVSFSRRSAK